MCLNSEDVSEGTDSVTEKMIVERTDFGKRIKINLLLTMSRLLELALVAFLRLLFTFYPEKGFEA